MGTRSGKRAKTQYIDSRIMNKKEKSMKITHKKIIDVECILCNLTSTTSCRRQIDEKTDV